MVTIRRWDFLTVLKCQEGHRLQHQSRVWTELCSFCLFNHSRAVKALFQHLLDHKLYCPMPVKTEPWNIWHKKKRETVLNLYSRWENNPHETSRLPSTGYRAQKTVCKQVICDQLECRNVLFFLAVLGISSHSGGHDVHRAVTVSVPN